MRYSDIVKSMVCRTLLFFVTGCEKLVRTNKRTDNMFKYVGQWAAHLLNERPHRLVDSNTLNHIPKQYVYSDRISGWGIFPHMLSMCETRFSIRNTTPLGICFFFPFQHDICVCWQQRAIACNMYVCIFNIRHAITLNTSTTHCSTRCSQDKHPTTFAKGSSIAQPRVFL